MKNIINVLNLVLVLFMAMRLNAQNVTIPDDNFKYALLNHNPVIDLNSNGEISIYEAQQFTGMLEVYFYGISDLTGIEAFTNITGLNCASNNLTAVDLSYNTQLQYLGCGANQITVLDVSALTQLQHLDCSLNLLTEIDVSALTQLVKLYCNYNQFSNLNIAANTQLEELVCHYNQLQNLDVSNNIQLAWLWCNNNQLTDLDLSANSSLIRLDCSYNQLMSLNVANGNNSNVTEMTAYDNPNLICIQHDIDFVPLFVWLKDDTASWSTDCSSLNTDNVSSLESSVTLYPNPAKDIVNIKAENLKSVVIYNLQGKQVLSTTNTQFSIMNLISGVYLVKIESANGVIVHKKLIVK